MHNHVNPLHPEWTILGVLQWATTYFKRNDIDSPRATAEILLAHALAAERIDLYLHYDQPLNAKELERFKAIIKRRIKREPVAYILGCKEFWSLELAVTPNVLIPRPETECLVERALTFLSARSESGRQRILELGTGSGAILIALASENAQHIYWGTDISAAAIQIAQRNALGHGLAANIHFLVADWFAPFAVSRDLFDMIISNPPYIRHGDLKRLQPEIQAFEPLVALDGSKDGLQCLRHIIQSAHLYLKPGGMLLLEMGHDQKAPLKQIIQHCDQYEDVAFYTDYSDYDRIVAMRKQAKS
ncbi:MAG: peptide chain release factor N(5)-glutamine methyltransferase [Deltaproteobacteria bacterium]|jgi:release factor glutamine methyltransferase|nr:peptide chain release factor N(5)-glutamine methyltransferase [Deltaproteobacteria bacterium]